MKAVLEFNYPDDELRLRRAVYADEAFTVLHALDQEVKYRWRKEDNLIDVLEFVRVKLDDILKLTDEK